MNALQRLTCGSLGAALALAITAGAAFAQTAGQPPAQSGEADVVLDVPRLAVEELTLEVDKLAAHLSLDARVSSLLKLTAGVDLTTDRISLTIKGVEAEAHLRVRLDDVVTIVDRTLTTLDRNPQLLTGLLNTVGNVLNQTVNSLGQTVTRVVDSTGNILERTLDSAGTIVNQQVLGNVSSLPVISETKNAAGQTVRQVRDSSGAVIEVVLDSAGKVLSTRVVSQALNTATSTAAGAAAPAR